MPRNGFPDWEKHEKEVQQWLGLNPTIGSGNKWHDISDGSTKGHPDNIAFPIMVDCKSTRSGSYSVNKKFFLKWIKDAGLRGRKFFMPIRFEEDDQKDLDLIVLDMNTFRDMLKVYKQYMQYHMDKDG